MNVKQMLFTALMAIGLGTSTTLKAHDHDFHRHHHGHQYKHWKHEHRGHYRGHVARERVLIERPVYVERVVHYAPPPPRYPALVLSVDIPPLVIPLR